MYGFYMIGVVSFDIVVYCVRYVMKKVIGDVVVFYYWEVDFEIGEIINEIKLEYCMMLVNKGIGYEWY